MSALHDMQVRLGADGQLWFRTGSLADRWVDTPNPLLEQYRQYWGRQLTPEIIEQVLYMADRGYMRSLTDLIYEATRIDPHWSMCDSKRLRAVFNAKTNVVAATGEGIDEKKAALYADVVRQQLAWVPNLKQVLCRLNFAHKNGRAGSEKIWRENARADGIGGPLGAVKWRIDRMNWIHPRRLSFGPDRELRVRDDVWGGLGFEARGLALRDYPYKFIGFLPQLYDEYPEREGYGSRALYFSFFKRFSKREQLVLLEVFGRPWRNLEEVDPSGNPVQADTLKDAAEQVDKMGAGATGYAPPGTRIVTTQPGQGAGQVHKDVFGDSNDEMSKLILGEVRTSDAKPSALGSAGDQVAKDVTDEVKSQDALALSDLMTEQFAADVIALNYDPGELDHCPRIEVFYEPPPNRTEEIERTTKAFSLGIPLVENEVYERIGFKKPAPGDVTIKQAPQPAGPFGNPSPNPGAQESGTPGAGASPLGDTGTGGKGPEDQANLAAPALFPSLLALARTDHVLSLASQLGQPSRIVREVVPVPPKTKPED